MRRVVHHLALRRKFCRGRRLDRITRINRAAGGEAIERQRKISRRRDGVGIRQPNAVEINIIAAQLARNLIADDRPERDDFILNHAAAIIIERVQFRKCIRAAADAEAAGQRAVFINRHAARNIRQSRLPRRRRLRRTERRARAAVWLNVAVAAIGKRYTEQRAGRRVVVSRRRRKMAAGCKTSGNRRERVLIAADKRGAARFCNFAEQTFRSRADAPRAIHAKNTEYVRFAIDDGHVDGFVEALRLFHRLRH